MKFESKYSIGDKVFHAYTRQKPKQHPCPDCLNTRTWQVTSPGGSDYKFACPRCSAPYQGNHKASLRYFEHQARAKPLTIGSVRVDTNADKPTTYMCAQTGIGSGTVYDEGNLFVTESEALHAAQLLADERNKEAPIIEKIKETLELSDYQLNSIPPKATAAHREMSLQAALKKYGEHLLGCKSCGRPIRRIDDFTVERHPCDCGFSDALEKRK